MPRARQPVMVAPIQAGSSNASADAAAALLRRGGVALVDKADDNTILFVAVLFVYHQLGQQIKGDFTVSCDHRGAALAVAALPLSLAADTGILRAVDD